MRTVEARRFRSFEGLAGAIDNVLSNRKASKTSSDCGSETGVEGDSEEEEEVELSVRSGDDNDGPVVSIEPWRPENTAGSSGIGSLGCDVAVWGMR